MVVQHLTSFSHNRPYRNTDDIKVETVNFFKFLEIQSGHLTIKIPNTPLTCRVTCSDRIAIFDLLEGEKLLFVNVCNFFDDKKEEALKYVDAMISKLPLKSESLNPDVAEFIYTLSVMPITTPDILSLCGEIEFYIYNALYRGQFKQ